MRTTQQRVTATSSRGTVRQQNMITTTTTNVQEFNLSNAIFVIDGKLAFEF
jgi:hypothetical protein